MFAAALPALLHGDGAEPGKGSPVWCRKSGEIADHEHSRGAPGWRGPVRPRRGRRGRAARRGLRRAATRRRRRPTARARAMRLGCRAATPCVERGDRGPGATSTPRSDELGCAARVELFSSSVGRMRGPASTSTMRASRGSMCAEVGASAWREISAIAPASSTPVGPPPTIAKVSRSRRAAASGSRSAASKASRMRRRISRASSRVFRPGASGSQARRGRSRRGRRRRRRRGSRSEIVPSARRPPGAPCRSRVTSASRTSAFVCRRRIERIG